jgi:hypothetical protein
MFLTLTLSSSRHALCLTVLPIRSLPAHHVIPTVISADRPSDSPACFAGASGNVLRASNMFASADARRYAVGGLKK